MINILPYKEKKLIKKSRTLRIAIVLVWSAILLTLVMGALLIPTVLTINNRYMIAQRQIALFEESGTVPKAVDVAALAARVNTLHQAFVHTQTTPPTVYLGIIRSLAREGVTITSFVKESTATIPTFQLRGVTTTRAALQNFVTVLEAHDQIASVDAPISNFVKSTNGGFTIAVVFKK